MGRPASIHNNSRFVLDDPGPLRTIWLTLISPTFHARIGKHEERKFRISAQLHLVLLSTCQQIDPSRSLPNPQVHQPLLRRGTAYPLEFLQIPSATSKHDDQKDPHSHRRRIPRHVRHRLGSCHCQLDPGFPRQPTPLGISSSPIYYRTPTPVDQYTQPRGYHLSDFVLKSSALSLTSARVWIPRADRTGCQKSRFDDRAGRADYLRKRSVRNGSDAFNAP